MENYLAKLTDVYPQLAGVGPRAALRFPVIPLGACDWSLTIDDRVRARRALGVSNDCVVLLYVGRLSPVLKCDLIPLLVAYAGINADARTPTCLVLAGDDTQHYVAQTLQQAATDLGCLDTVIIRPNVTHSEKRALYAAADIFVSPSDNIQETFGLAIIEAMAASLPVVASDWNGYRDLVVHEETGFLVPTVCSHLGGRTDALVAVGPPEHDGTLAGATIVDINHLRRSLHVLIQDRARRCEMGRRGHDVFMKQFDWPVVIGLYEELWLELHACARQTNPSAIACAPLRDVVVDSVFSHYPTRMLTDAQRVVLGPMGHRPDDVMGWIAQMPTPHVGTAQLAKTLLSQVAEGSARIDALVESLLTDSDSSDLEVRLLVARLIKYGALSLAGDSSQ